jgi:hypothetical protein
MKKKLLTLSALIFTGVAFSQTTIVLENFEGTGLPSGWSKTQNTPSVGWEFGNNLGSQYWAIPTHTKYAASNDDAHDTQTATANLANLDRLISPVLDLTAHSVVLLSFDAFFTGQYSSTANVEVSTNGGTTWTSVKTMTAGAAWQDGILVNLSAYAGQNNVLVAFRHNDNAAWASGFAIDNAHIYVPAPVDAQMTALNFAEFQLAPGNATITGTITNLGASTLTSIDIDWNDGTSHNQTFSVNIAPLGTYNFSHGTTLSLVAGTNPNITVTVNATSDAVAGNNSLSKTLYACSFLPTTKVLGEEGTGTWCQWCPRGAVFMDQMAADFPNTWVGVAVHNADPMTVTAYDNAIGNLISGYPSGLVDRADGEFDPSDFPAQYAVRLAKTRPAEIAVSNTWNPTTRVMSVKVDATFAASMSGVNMRLAAIVVEDDVTGTTSGYNQVNNYAGGNFGPMGGYENLPNPVPAAQMVYDHVARAMLPSFAGQTGSIPSSVTFGSTHTYTFNYTVPATQDETQMKVIGILINSTTGEIVNTNESNAVLGLTEVNDVFEFSLYPNPANDISNIKLNIREEGDVTIDIYNIAGTLVNSTNYGSMNGTQNFQLNTLNYEQGVYFVNATVNGSVISKKMIITH